MTPNSDLLTFPFPRHTGYQPSPENARLRNNDPVSKVQLFDGSQAWWVGKQKDVCKALQSDKLSKDRRKPGFPELYAGGKEKAIKKKPTFVDIDDPEHAWQRSMLEYSFTPEAIDELRPMIQQIVDDTIENMKKKDRAGKTVDFIEEFATPVPTMVVYRILGIPEEDIEDLSKKSEVRTSASSQAAESTDTSLQEYVAKLVEKRIEKPGNDLISKLVVEQYKTGRLTKEDISDLSFLVLVAGNAALLNLIALGTLTLLQHPKQLEELKSNSSLVKPMVNELLRYHTTSALNGRRVATKDLELGGKHIKAGEGVITANQSADRDEDVYPNPDEFDIHREHPKPILSFGYGPHRCQAEWLVRAELEAVFSTLFQKLPNLRLAVPEKEIKYTPATKNVGITELPVTF